MDFKEKYDQIVCQCTRIRSSRTFKYDIYHLLLIIDLNYLHILWRQSIPSNIFFIMKDFKLCDFWLSFIEILNTRLNYLWIYQLLNWEHENKIQASVSTIYAFVVDDQNMYQTLFIDIVYIYLNVCHIWSFTEQTWFEE